MKVERDGGEKEGDRTQKMKEMRERVRETRGTHYEHEG